MAVVNGITGAVSWAGSAVNAQLTTTGARGRNFRLNIGGESFDKTGFDTAGMVGMKKGLFGPVSGSFDVYMKTTDHGGGTNGLITYAAGTVLNSDAWSMNIRRLAIPSTVFGATSLTRIPGLVSVDGDFEGFLDGTTVSVLPVNSSEPATGTFKYWTSTVPADYTLAGSIFTNQQEIESSPQNANRYKYSYVMDGTLTHSSPAAADGILVNGALDPLDPATVLTLTASTGRTFEGSAFWTGINMKCRTGALVEATIEFQGTGLWAIA